MYYVALLTIIDADLNAKVRPAHLEYVNRLYKENKVLMAGPFTDGKGGMVIYRADSFEEAKRLAEADPVVAEGARTLELREWNPLQFPLD
ncbi:MAG: hypothetical protein BAA01_07440 [Bacillus thermozeamaize]|jgi:hypothetical protein|uniref:YCII-related domain-containing protein n=1 Tax=Bacillus thermozeamaize TaxID=230954 RepID=A0A1Y3PTY9_9BACI|nr:MAG: hypothetical protein BAA01_07440 [Bacillus thermozeamaize]